MLDGRIVMSGGRELAEKIDRDGYDWVERENAATAAQTA
jgi:Fe-S cluster assembly ATPase SufC